MVISERHVDSSKAQKTKMRDKRRLLQTDNKKKTRGMAVSRREKCLQLLFL